MGDIYQPNCHCTILEKFLNTVHLQPHPLQKPLFFKHEWWIGVELWLYYCHLIFLFSCFFCLKWTFPFVYSSLKALFLIHYESLRKEKNIGKKIDNITEIISYISRYYTLLGKEFHIFKVVFTMFLFTSYRLQYDFSVQWKSSDTDIHDNEHCILYNYSGRALC